MNEPLSIGFVDFWDGFDPTDNFFTRLLSRRFSLRHGSDPQVVFYSCFGKLHRNYRGLRIFYTGENVRPDFTRCDYALSFDYLADARHRRLPLYVLQASPDQLRKTADFDPQRVLRQKTRFCNFVYGNPRCRKRNQFFRRLSEYKHVDAAGSLFNNMDRIYRPKEKVVLLRSYRFTIAFENSRYPGYTTEKIVQPMVAYSLPIYWGNPWVDRDFNPDSFVWCDRFRNDAEVIDRIRELDSSEQLYCDTMAQSWFPEGRVTDWFDQDQLLEFLYEAIRSNTVPVSRRRLTAAERFVRLRHRLHRNVSRVWRDLTSPRIER